MMRTATLFALVGLLLAACQDRHADVIYRVEESSGGATGTGTGGAPDAELSTEPSCEGEALEGALLREYELLLGRLMTWQAGTQQRAEEQAPLEVARYFDVDALPARVDAETLGTELLETLNVSQRAELVTLAEDQAQDLDAFRTGRNALIAELWALQESTEADTDTVTVLATQGGRNEGKLALRYIDTMTSLNASLTGAQKNHLGQFLTGDTAATPSTPEVEELLGRAYAAELLALAVKAYAQSQSPRLPPGESERRIASYFGYAYFVIDKDSPNEDGSFIRSQLARDIYAELDREQRNVACQVLKTQEQDIRAFQDTRSSFVSSAFGMPPGDEETLLALHSALGSIQGRIGLRQAQLYRTLGESLSIEQRDALEELFLAYGTTQ